MFKNRKIYDKNRTFFSFLNQFYKFNMNRSNFILFVEEIAFFLNNVGSFFWLK